MFRRRVRRKLKIYRSWYREKLVAPETLNLDNKDTLNFLNDVRKNADDPKCSLYVDFKGIKNITPSCALVFTSELDRMSRIRGKRNRLKVVDFDKWDTAIKFLLRDMGMFDLLNIPNIPPEFAVIENTSDIRFFKFIAGDSISGDQSANFRDVIKQAISGVPNEKKLQIAITEAMDNVFNHGYPDDFIETSKLKEKLWWLSASFNNKTQTLNLMFFDQGIGIPKSLPRIHPGLFGKIVELFDTDDKIIEAATKAGKSATGKKYRGKGFPQIIEYVSSYKKSGYIRITSGKGTYQIIKKVNEKAEKRSYINKNDIQGTLLEWQLEL